MNWSKSLLSFWPETSQSGRRKAGVAENIPQGVQASTELVSWKPPVLGVLLGSLFSQGVFGKTLNTGTQRG